MNDRLDPKEWGWKVDGPMLSPVMTDQAPACTREAFEVCEM